MLRYSNIVYIVLSVFILGFGITILCNGEGKLWANIGIILIGLYFLYKGIAVTVNNSRRKERARMEEDSNDDPANA